MKDIPVHAYIGPSAPGGSKPPNFQAHEGGKVFSLMQRASLLPKEDR